jgi:hypothetical protein
MHGLIALSAKIGWNLRVLSKTAQCLTTVIARHEELPAASKAFTVTVLLPTNRGITADQEVVPVAAPVLPVEVVQFTDATPTLSLAVPLIDMVAV